MNAKKQVYAGESAIEILRSADTVHIAKGKNVQSFNMKLADMNEVLALALGPTGNLRAPALRMGKTLVIGFNETVYQKVLG